jgi:hypothetical protein
MSLQPTKGDENALCGARLQACCVDSRVDVPPRCNCQGRRPLTAPEGRGSKDGDTPGGAGLQIAAGDA